MTFRISLTQAANKAKLGSQAKVEAGAKERNNTRPVNKVLAGFHGVHSDDDATDATGGRLNDEATPNVVVPTGAKRHYAERVRTGKSGPGTLELESSSGFFPGRLGGQHQSNFSGSVQQPSSPRDISNAYSTLIGKASNLPLDTVPSSLESLFIEYPSLKVEKVEKLPPSGPSHRGRPSVTMLITFDKDASLADLTKALVALNDKKYLGQGYYLHLDRYLGSNSASNSEQRREEPPPFGAQWIKPEVTKKFAPPPDLGGHRGQGGGPRSRQEEERFVVTVEQPSNLVTLKLIHQTVEGVIQGGQEFEAALMQDPRVMGDEKFVWLYDSKHPHSRYYRWRLHQMISSTSGSNIFQGEAEWLGPKAPLLDEYANHIEDLDPEYTEPEIDEDEGKIQRGLAESSLGMLSPADRTMFMWLLANLPPFALMNGDVAPFTTFAVDHVDKGMGEIIDLLISNIIVPFNLTEAKANYRPAKQDGDEYRQKISKASTNALRIVSDLALTTFKDRSLTLTWKCRQAIGDQLISRNVFEHLESLPYRVKMGRMSEEIFREDVNSVLEVWGKETLFDHKTLKLFDNAFNERKRVEKQERDQANRKRQPKRIKKPVKAADKSNLGRTELGFGRSDDVVMGNMDGASDEPPSPQEVVETVEAETPEEYVKTLPEQHQGPPPEDGVKHYPTPVEIPRETAAAPARRMRPKAEDMFASNEE